MKCGLMNRPITLSKHHKHLHARYNQRRRLLWVAFVTVCVLLLVRRIESRDNLISIPFLIAQWQWNCSHSFVLRLGDVYGCGSPCNVFARHCHYSTAPCTPISPPQRPMSDSLSLSTLRYCPYGTNAFCVHGTIPLVHMVRTPSARTARAPSDRAARVPFSHTARSQ